MEILCFTGTRADYGIIRPLLFEMEKDEQIGLKLVVTGMHLLGEYGRTIEEIQRDPFTIVSTPSILVKGDTTYAMSQSLALANLYFSDLIHHTKPSFVLLLGDRGEMLAAALAAHYQNVGIIHLHGGELSGSADDAIRHAISKLAHLHFVACREAKQFLLRSGEESWRIVPVGSLRKSVCRQIKSWSPDKIGPLIEKYRLSSGRKKILLAMHPDSKETLTFAGQIDPVLDALREFAETDLLIIGPNSDAGGDLFRERLLRFAAQTGSAYFASVPSEEFLFLLSAVDVFVGNSSSGIIEAPFFGLPFVNIGSRQKNRTHANTVIHTEFDAIPIQRAVERSLQAGKAKAAANPYDLKESPEKAIVETIKSMSGLPFLLRKNFSKGPF